MRTLVAVLVAGLVLVSCERPSVEPTPEAEAPKKTAKAFVVGSRLLKTGRAVPGRYIVALDEKALAVAHVEELAHELSSLHGASVEHVYSRALHGFSATMTQEAVLRLSNDPRVRYVALAASINAGVFYAVAAGNGTKDACTVSPARLPAAMTVAATNRADAWASSFSNHGACVDHRGLVLHRHPPGVAQRHLDGERARLEGHHPPGQCQ